MKDVKTITTTRTFHDGESIVVLLPDDVSFGPNVDVILTRVGDVITMRRKYPDTPEPDRSDPDD